MVLHRTGSENMYLRRLIILSLIAFYKCQQFENKTELISLIADFIKWQNSPIKISYYICWRKENSVEFMNFFFMNYRASLFKMNMFYGIPEHQLFVLDLTCDNAVEILKTAEYLRLFKHPFRWLLYGSGVDLSNFNFDLNSQIYIIHQNKSNLYKISTIYKYNLNSTHLVENDLAIWSPKQKLLIDSEYTVSNRTNLMGTLIRISHVIINLDSLNHLTDYRHTNTDAITKLNYMFINHLMDFLNATRKFIVQRTWGYKNPTGIYEGMMGDLQKGIADIGGSPLIYTIDRMEHVDYLAATTPANILFIFKAPPLSYVTNIFTLPFDTTIWYCSFIMIAVIPVCIYIISIWEWKDPIFREKIQKQVNILTPKFFDVIMLDIGAISQQGTDVEPKSIAGRIATIFTFLTLMFMYTSFSANIVALLQSTTDSIKTLEDLLNSRLELGVEDLPYGHYYFENSEDPIRKTIYQKKVAPVGQKPNFMTSEEGMRRVREGFFAFHTELTTGYKYVSDTFHESEKCGLQEIEYVHLCEPSLGTRKHSEYKEVMKIGLRKIRESGIYKREVLRIYTRKPVCHGKGSNFGSVGMIDCYAAFLCFGIGAALALKLLILEVIIEKFSLKQNFTKINGNRN